MTVISGSVPTFSFKTIDAPLGTDPVAESATDTLYLTSDDSSVLITGDLATKTLNFAVSLAGFSTTDLSEGDNLYFTDERAQDAVGTILTDSPTVDFTYDDGTGAITAVVIPGGIDHGALADLTSDDHSQYALLAGRSGGQTLKGGTASGDDLTLSSTDHATKGSVIIGSKFYFDEANGYLGIGLDQPARELDIQSDGSTCAIRMKRVQADGSSGSLVMMKSRGTIATNAIVENGDQLGSISFRGYDGSGMVNAAEIKVFVSGTPGSNDMPGVLILGTTSDNSSTVMDRMRLSDNINITNNCNLLFGVDHSSPPASMQGGISMKNGTAPTGDVTDAFSMYAADISAGVAAPHFRTEAGDVIKLFQAAVYSLSNPDGTRTLNVSNSNAATVRSVLGSVIQDLQSIGLFG